MRGSRLPVAKLTTGVLLACCIWACSSPDQGSGPSDESPSEAPLQVFTVCEAARQPVGATVHVTGTFEGFGYEMKSKRVVLESDAVCNDRGAGLVFATLRSDEERDRLGGAHEGDVVVLTGIVEKVEQGRFVYLNRVSVGP